MFCTTDANGDISRSIMTWAFHLINTTWAIHYTYHTVLKASPGAAIFGRDMVFDIPYIADWSEIGDYRQH
jgi:hypothetical protein